MYESLGNLVKLTFIACDPIKVFTTTIMKISSQTEDDKESINSNDGYSNTSIPADIVIFTPKELLWKGLRLVRYKKPRIKRAREATNVKRFQDNFGGNPQVVLQLWEDLQTTDIQEAYLHEDDRKINMFLMALYHLRKYPTESDRERIFDLSRGWSRDHVWFFLEKIKALKDEKIIWPYENKDDIWICSVDGTHVWSHEVGHPEFSLDPEYYSHKHNKSGLTFELAISLKEQRLIWLNGGFKSGANNDVGIFKEEGLQDRLRQVGKMAIGDGGYAGQEEISSPNSIDSRPVRKFKSRALKRHEKFNGFLKVYNCLNGRFRQSPDKLTTCFVAVCVLVQYQLDLGQSYLFDILIEDVLKED